MCMYLTCMVHVYCRQVCECHSALPRSPELAAERRSVSAMAVRVTAVRGAVGAAVRVAVAGLTDLGLLQQVVRINGDARRVVAAVLQASQPGEQQLQDGLAVPADPEVVVAKDATHAGDEGLSVLLRLSQIDRKSSSVLVQLPERGVQLCRAAYASWPAQSEPLLYTACSRYGVARTARQKAPSARRCLRSSCDAGRYKLLRHCIKRHHALRHDIRRTGGGMHHTTLA